MRWFRMQLPAGCPQKDRVGHTRQPGRGAEQRMPQDIGRRVATTALTLEEKLAGQKRIKALESQRNEKRRSLFDAQDEVDRQRDSLIASIEGKLAQRITSTELFSVRWGLR